MFLQLLLLFLVGWNATLAKKGFDPDECKAPVDKEDIVQLSVLAATKHILQQVEKFNKEALDPIWAKYMTETIVKDLLKDISIEQVLKNQHHRCVNKIPPKDDENAGKKLKGKKEIARRRQATGDKKGSGHKQTHAPGHICMIEMSEEKCYEYIYSEQDEIIIGRESSKPSHKPKVDGEKKPKSDDQSKGKDEGKDKKADTKT